MHWVVYDVNVEGDFPINILLLFKKSSTRFDPWFGSFSRPNTIKNNEHFTTLIQQQSSYVKLIMAKSILLFLEGISLHL